MNKLLGLALLAALGASAQLNVQEANGNQDALVVDVWARRLIETAPGVRTWMREEEIFDLIGKQVKFFDVTDGDLDAVASLKTKYFPPPSAPSFSPIVSSLIENITISNLEAFLTEFSRFHTRFFKTDYARQSSEWLFEQVSKVADTVSTVDPIVVTVKKFSHDWPQSSVIARIEPREGVVPRPTKWNRRADDLPLVIVGAHQDSVNLRDPYGGRSPGADDDGSGTTTIFEAFRVLVENKFVPARPIEFQWYSAEEGGLLGSQKIAAAYKARDVPVAAMIQFDMTGYNPPNREGAIALGSDNVDPAVTAFVKKLVDEYATIPYVDMACGYGCSDHASWKRAGYASSFAIEAPLREASPYIHSPSDDIPSINFNHMTQFVRLAISFAVEFSLAE